MRTALDTNILSAIWSGDPSAAAVKAALLESLDHGSLVLCPIVYAELRAYAGATHQFVDSFLSTTRIAID